MRNVRLTEGGVRERRKLGDIGIVGDVGKIARSKIDSLYAGSSGEPVGRIVVDGNEQTFGGSGIGLIGDRGDSMDQTGGDTVNGDGLSGIQ
jgi:hypothetical protein